MAFYLTTQKRYSLFEVASALQKDIRRANEDGALFWALELETSNYGEYLWKRLLIISMEDIGPANPTAVSYILALKEAYTVLKKKKSGETTLAVAAAVISLARSEKSRLYDWARCCATRVHSGSRPEIPEYALDIHTARGRRMGKTVADFFEDGSKLHPHAPAARELEYMEKLRVLKLTAPANSEPPADEDAGQEEFDRL